MEDVIDPALLGLYYRQFYPFELIHKWLSYGNEFLFSKREFSIVSSDDKYMRYLSYESLADFRNDIVSKCPAKIDIGAIFSSKPRIHRIISSQSFFPIERELVFDIDLTDYDDVRFCCSQTKICRKCWSLVSVAAKIIDKALEEDFGFKNRLWVFSGRRGIHCWVCDDRAKRLSNTNRSAIVDYLSLIKGGEHRDKKVSLTYPLHHSIRRAADKIETYFENIYIENQPEIFEKENISKIFNLIPGKDILFIMVKVQKNLYDAVSLIENQPDSFSKWAIIKSKIYHVHQKNTKIADELMFQYCYPRIDINVSKSMNHLLKSPFCIHPKTGSVCVPIDINMIEEFDLRSVPNIHQLFGVEEEDEKDGESEFKRYIDFLRDFINTIYEVSKL